MEGKIKTSVNIMKPDCVLNAWVGSKLQLRSFPATTSSFPSFIRQVLAVEGTNRVLLRGKGVNPISE